MNPILKNLDESFAEQLYKIYKDERIFCNLGAPFSFEDITLDFERDFLRKKVIEVNEKKEFCKGIFLDDVLIGVIGTKGINYEKSETEFGYWIGYDHWGKGYGSKAIELFLEQLFIQVPIKRVYAEVYSTNIGSIKVLEKNGFEKYSQKESINKVTNEKVVNYFFELFRKDFNFK